MGKIRVKKLDDRATIPKRGSPGAAGLDLYPIESGILRPNTRNKIHTGIAVQLEPGTYGRIAPRSGNSVKLGIEVGAGVIDCDYRGELIVNLIHTGTQAGEPTNLTLKRPPLLFQPQGYTAAGDVSFSPDKAIAQLIIERIDMPDVEEVSGDEELDATERGGGGFGSTDSTPAEVASGDDGSSSNDS